MKTGIIHYSVSNMSPNLINSSLFYLHTTYTGWGAMLFQEQFRSGIEMEYLIPLINEVLLSCVPLSHLQNKFLISNMKDKLVDNTALTSAILCATYQHGAKLSLQLLSRLRAVLSVGS